jgi:hypothetical protein
VLVERGRRSVGARRRRRRVRARHRDELGGGTHHAGRDSRAATACSTTSRSRSRGCAPRAARRALVVDRRPPGDGTAQILGPDPDAFTLSCTAPATTRSSESFRSRCRSADRHRRRRYLSALDALDTALHFDFDVASTSPAPTRGRATGLGRLADQGGLRAATSTSSPLAERAPVVVVLAGGYAPDVNDTVDINAATLEVVLSLS